MAPPVPDKIPCTSADVFASQLRNIQDTLAIPETEDSWDKLARALQQLSALTRGGASKLDPEYVNAIKANYKPITNSMASERSRLSAAAMELLSTFAPRLGSRFEPLVPMIMPTLMKLLARPSKIFVTRAQTCLLLIIEHCHLPSIVPHLREGVKDKSQSLRLGAAEATLLVVECFDPALLAIREGASTIIIRHKGNVEDIESIIKDTARDANPGVRQVSRKIFEKYMELWPERVDAFTAPFTPTIRRYLNVNANGGGGSKPTKPAPALKVKAAPRAPVEPANVPLPAGPSRPYRPKAEPQQEIYSPPVLTSHSTAPPSRPPSRMDRGGPSNFAAVQHRPPPKPANPYTQPRAQVPEKVVPDEIDALMNAEARSASRAGNRRPEVDFGSSGSSSAVSAPSRPPSRSQHHFYNQEPTRPVQTPTPQSQNPTSRPVAQVHRPAPPPEPVQPPIPKSTSSSNFFRVQRPPKPETVLSSGPVANYGPARPVATTTRTVSMKDPPSRPVRREMPPPKVTSKEEAKPPQVVPDEKPKATPKDEVKPTQAVAGEKLKSDEIDLRSKRSDFPAATDSRPPSAMENALKAPSRPVSRAEETPKTVVNRPPSSASVSGSSTTKRPAVLQKRAGVVPPGQAQGFAPTRKRPGLTEPTLSQMARQKPTMTFVPAAKKADIVAPPAAPKKPAPTASTVAPKTAPPPPKKKVAPPPAKATKVADARKIAPAPPPVRPPVELPKEVKVAMVIPLPPPTHDEVPLPSDDEDPEEEDVVEVEAPQQSTTPPAPPALPLSPAHAPATSEDEDEGDITIEATPRAPTNPKPMYVLADVSSLLDFGDTTIMMPTPSITPSSNQPSHQIPSGADLMDFDMSVILPEDRFAPLAASTPAQFTVHRDTSPPNPMFFSAPVTSKPRPKDMFGTEEERIALSEVDPNTILIS